MDNRNIKVFVIRHLFKEEFFLGEKKEGGQGYKRERSIILSILKPRQCDIY